MFKKGELNNLIIGLDIIGFVLFFIGGFVVAGSVAILSITRIIKK